MSAPEHDKEDGNSWVVMALIAAVGNTVALVAASNPLLHTYVAGWVGFGQVGVAMTTFMLSLKILA